MDTLNKYKEIWKNQDMNMMLDSNSLAKMIHKKSSSIVKWIYYISLIEFSLILLLNLLLKTDWEYYKANGLYKFMRVYDILAYIIIVVFIYLFYKNYKNISANDTTRELLKNIIKTRKTVKYYIIINIVFITLSMFYSIWIILQNEQYQQLINDLGNRGYILVWALLIFSILFISSIIYGFYSLIYGILIKRLNKNYKELIEETLK